MIIGRSRARGHAASAVVSRATPRLGGALFRAKIDRFVSQTQLGNFRIVRQCE